MQIPRSKQINGAFFIMLRGKKIHSGPGKADRARGVESIYKRETQRSKQKLTKVFPS